VVLHATVFESLHQTVRHFCRQASRVSAHYVIGKEGGIVQCVSVFRRAWHAGESRDAEGRPKVNDFSLGIELVNRNDGFDPFPQEQTDALCALIRSLSRRFPLTRVTSHACIALPPGRKTDPKGFPWQTLAASGLKVVG
jgi:N-acetyl-anhydromuramyl-L-alanine amidase AmpD